MDADLRWLADARQPDPEHQNRMLEGAMRPWATPAEAAQYTGSGWFSGEALHSFTDAEEDEIAVWFYTIELFLPEVWAFGVGFEICQGAFWESRRSTGNK